MLPTTCSTGGRRVRAWRAFWLACWARLPASVACWSASLALADAWRIPSCARASTSLMFLALAAVRSSSSFTRLRIGLSWRCTYFLRAKGLILPQNPWRSSGCSGWCAVMFWSELALWLESVEEDDEDCELLCDMEIGRAHGLNP